MLTCAVSEPARLISRIAASVNKAGMDKLGKSGLILGQKAWDGLGQVGREQVCVLKAQVVVKGAVEDHVCLVLNGGGSALQTGAMGAGGLGGCR